jgi:hypothetical protein
MSQSKTPITIFVLKKILKKKKKPWRFSQLVNMSLTSAAITPNFKACGVK